MNSCVCSLQSPERDSSTWIALGIVTAIVFLQRVVHPLVDAPRGNERIARVAANASRELRRSAGRHSARAARATARVGTTSASRAASASCRRVAASAVLLRDDQRVTAQRLSTAVEREPAQIGATEPNASARDASLAHRAPPTPRWPSSRGRHDPTTRRAQRVPPSSRQFSNAISYAVRRSEKPSACCISTTRPCSSIHARIALGPSVAMRHACTESRSRDRPATSRLVEPRAVRHRERRLRFDANRQRLRRHRDRVEARQRVGAPDLRCLAERDRDRDHRREHDRARQPRRAACRPPSRRARSRPAAPSRRGTAR